MYKRI